MTTSLTLLTATGREREAMPGFPPVAAERIAVYLRAGVTGQIVLNVKCGEIRSCHLTEVVDVSAPPSPPAVGMVQSES